MLSSFPLFLSACDFKQQKTPTNIFLSKYLQNPAAPCQVADPILILHERTSACTTVLVLIQTSQM